MATTKEYLTYVLEQLAGVEEISHRAMMGEYVLYYRGKVIGGVYDNRFLVKPTPSAAALLPDAPREIPYEGAKEMLLVGEMEPARLEELFRAMYDELPARKQKKPKQDR